MVSQKYRWDFIGLSTDTKPTSETSDKVVNGSTYYCSDTSKLYVYCDGTWYERKPLGGGGGGGTSNFNDLSNRPKYNGSEMTGSTDIPEVKSYTAGTNVSISEQNVISASDTTYTAGTGLTLTGTQFSADTSVLATQTDLSSKQNTLTAGSNITISDNTISATDTTYSNFTGTDGTAAGTAGLVPAPATTDAGKFLKADGTWDTAGGGSGPTVVQTTGTSQTDVMSQNAVTSMVFADPATQYKIRIGAGTAANEGTEGIEIGHDAKATQSWTIAIGKDAIASNYDSGALGESSRGSGESAWGIGYGATASGDGAISFGGNTKATQKGSIAIGRGAESTVAGVFSIGADAIGLQTYGYNGGRYRLLTGVHDPVNAHDAATKGYVDPTTDSSAPTTATVGRLGQIQIDTTNADAYMCVAVDDVTPSYTWKKITA